MMRHNRDLSLTFWSYGPIFFNQREANVIRYITCMEVTHKFNVWHWCRHCRYNNNCFEFNAGILKMKILVHGKIIVLIYNRNIPGWGVKQSTQSHIFITLFFFIDIWIFVNYILNQSSNYALINLVGTARLILAGDKFENNIFYCITVKSVYKGNPREPLIVDMDFMVRWP